MARRARGDAGVDAVYAWRIIAWAEPEHAMAHLQRAENAFSSPTNLLAISDGYQSVRRRKKCYSAVQFAIKMIRTDPTRLVEH